MRLSATPEQAQDVLKHASLLFSESDINAALDSMAEQISQDLARRNPLILCVMNGAVMTMGALLARLSFPLQCDYLHATRYQGQLRGGELSWRAKPDWELSGRHILVIDDILDSGLTLAAVTVWLKEQGAASIHHAVLVDKPKSREPGGLAHASYTGLCAGGEYLFGFGMDYKEYWRNLPAIYAAQE